MRVTFDRQDGSEPLVLDFGPKAGVSYSVFYDQQEVRAEGEPVGFKFTGKTNFELKVKEF